MRCSNLRFVLAATVMAFCGIFASAQTITGSISGTVSDPSGAVIKGAKVTATNVETGVSVTDTTNASGIYSIRFLQIGKYKVLTDAKGFTKQSYGPFTLEIDQTAKVDLKLSVGGDSTKVDVSSSATPLLDTEDSTISTTISANTIENSPLNGRNFSSLTMFLPGSVSTNPVTFGGTASQGQGTERNTNGGGADEVQVNGNRAQTNNYVLDGIEINETINNLIGYNPNPDALAEVKVISANAPAEYSNVNGGDVIMVTKSGTNRFHGSASAFVEDYKLDANTFANKNHAAGQQLARNAYTQSVFSATFGGPIIKDKLFFFADYFGERYHQGGTSTASILDAKERVGDFSELLNPAIMCASTGGVCASQASLIQLYDPSNNFAPFMNNQIPVNNPIVKYLAANASIYPLPNLTPTINTPDKANYGANTHSSNYNNQFDVKVDYTPTAKDRISVRYLQGSSGDSKTTPLAIQFPGASVYPDKGVAINYVRNITPSIVNEFRAGYTRIRWNQSNPNDTSGLFGYNGNSIVGIGAKQTFQGFSAQSVSGFSTIGANAGGTNFIDNTFVYSDLITWQRGKHLLKAGAEFVRYQQNNYYPGNSGADGTFTYTGIFSSDSLITGGVATPSGKGYNAADFVLDRVQSDGIGGVAGRTGQRQWRSGAFIQDDWKLLSNLTLNLGLRWDYFEPIYEVNNKEANLNFQTQAVELAGQNGNSRALYTTPHTNFEPRVGFSYQPVPKVVVRGGFGITRALEGTGANLRLTYNPPFQPSLTLTGTNPNPATNSPGVFFQVQNGFTSTTPNYGGGTTFYVYTPVLKPEATNTYSLTTEYLINNFSTLKLGYVGELSTHLIQAVVGNQLTTPCILGGVVSSTPNSAACQAADPAPFVNAVGQGGTVVETATNGAADYNALQAQYRQRTTKGLEFTVNYAYGHAFSNSTGFFGISGVVSPSPYAQNAYNNHAEWASAPSDVKHNLNATAVYAVPYGRGKEFGSNVNRAVDYALGGWKVAMTGIAYGGFPITITSNVDLAYVNNNSGAARPNQISNVKFKHSANFWFGGSSNQGAIKYADVTVPGTFGNAKPASERGPTYQQYDFSLFKDFTIYHEEKLNFRMDAFNAFNITSLGNPSNNIDSSNFGAITSAKSPQRQIQFSAKYQF